MRIDDYTPYISALSMAPNVYKTAEKVSDQKLLRIEDLLSLANGEYLLSLNNPKCSIDKKITKNISPAFFLKRDNLIKYYLVDAVVHIGLDSIEEIVSKIIVSTNIMKFYLINHAPDFQEHFVHDIDLCLKELLTANGLKHLLPIT